MKQSRETYELLILVESSHSKQHLPIDRLINAENILSAASSDYAIFFYFIWTRFKMLSICMVKRRPELITSQTFPERRINEQSDWPFYVDGTLREQLMHNKQCNWICWHP